MSEHTPEPWLLTSLDTIVIQNPDKKDRIQCIINCIGATRNDLRRIVACVNACQGIPTEELEKRDVNIKARELADFLNEADDRRLRISRG